MDLALYHPRYGYYNQETPVRGRAGDYFTSLQVSDLFPQIFSEAILQLKETLGSDQFSLIEMGAGNGEFLEKVLMALDNKSSQTNSKTGGLKVWAVERSRPARDHLVKRLSRFPRCQVVSSIDDIGWMGTLEGCIFSNEFFDALPFHRLRWREGSWKEIFLDRQNDSWVELEMNPSIATPFLSDHLQDGHEIEVRPQMSTVFKEWSERLSRGYILTVDYGHPQESFLSPSRSKGTLMCYHKHQASKSPYERMGQQDITAHVDFTQLVEAGKTWGFDPFLFCSQGIFLAHVGQKAIEQFLTEGAVSQQQKRAGVVQQILHPDAMGETFWVLLQSKGADKPPLLASVPSRLRRLV
ncbi:MAG: hypothetical protein KCHDKBKB_01247 [Elusimicrobia bacterium]|nr:hypothetical protein [Elusimicrobiota bacterium]